MPFLQKNNIKIYYEIEPIIYEKTADTLIFIHANVMDHTIYDSMVSLLQDDFQILRYDLRGFGSSDLGDKSLSIDLYVDDLKFLIDSLQLQSVHLVGFGFGGLIALKFSTLYEKLVEKLVLMTMACFPEESYESLRAHREKISKGGTKIPVDTLIQKVTSLSVGDPEYARIQQMICKVPVSTYQKIMDLTLYTNPIPLMEKTIKSTLILAAEREVIFPQNLLTLHTSYLANFHYTVVPNSSSFLMIDQPKITAQLIKEFFKKEKQQIYSKDKITNEIYENVRHYTENVFKVGEKIGEDTNKIRIDVLQSFHVEINGKQITKGWNQRYAKQILIFLLFHETVTREQICEMLWPETSLQTSKANLRVYLNHLKQILNTTSVNEPILMIDREHIYLKGDISSDALAFISDIQQALEEDDELVKYRLTQKILHKISAPTYLTVIFDDWFLEIRDKVEHDFIHLMIEMGQGLVSCEEWQAAEQVLRKALFIFTDHEQVNAKLIELFSQIPKSELKNELNE